MIGRMNPMPKVPSLSSCVFMPNTEQKNESGSCHSVSSSSAIVKSGGIYEYNCHDGEEHDGTTLFDGFFREP